MAQTKRRREANKDGDGDGDGDGDSDGSCVYEIGGPDDADESAKHDENDGPPRKRARTHRSPLVSPDLLPPASPDYLSPLSDELLIRILGHLSLKSLLSLAPVSRRFHRLADDSQLWKAIYCERFVLPRAMRIPGIRAGALSHPGRPNPSGADTAGDVATMAHVRQQDTASATPLTRERHVNGSRVAPNAASGFRDDRKISWKQRYRLRHNWERGSCAVEELRLGSRGADGPSSSVPRPCDQGQDGDGDGDNHTHRMLVKVVDGIAVTADQRQGLRVWEPKSRSLVAAETLQRQNTRSSAEKDAEARTEAHGPGETATDCPGSGDESNCGRKGTSGDAPAVPSSLAVDLTESGLDIAVGFLDGGFELWQLSLPRRALVCRFSHPASSNGALTGIAYAHPYVLTATDAVLISLYAFEPRPKLAPTIASLSKSPAVLALPAPRLLTSLRSHTSRPPLALSIRKLASVAIASIAYTFSTRQGWSIGIQDLHVTAGGSRETNDVAADGAGLPTVAASRLAFTAPISTTKLSSPVTPRRRRRAANLAFPSPPDSNGAWSQSALEIGPASESEPVSPLTPPSSSPPATARGRLRELHRGGRAAEPEEGGPTTLCYSHPYLLAAMPDNTLILHLCTSDASRLAISAGVRLWGHTSGISDAEITARGKAVSVSLRGDEMRVWELEGRPAAERGRSVAIRPNTTDADAIQAGSGRDAGAGTGTDWDWNWDERRNWVGFDDEMVIVLKESRGGRESLMVYDFT